MTTVLAAESMAEGDMGLAAAALAPGAVATALSLWGDADQQATYLPPFVGDSRVYAACVQRSRIAWAALAVGTGQAVLDYAIPCVKEREASGAPDRPRPDPREGRRREPQRLEHVHDAGHRRAVLGQC